MKTREDYIDEWGDGVRERRDAFFNRFYHVMTDEKHSINLGYLYDLELSRMIWAARNDLVSLGYVSRDAEDLLLYGYKSIDTVLDIRSTEKVIRSAGINRTLTKSLLSVGAEGLRMSPSGSYRVTTAVDGVNLTVDAPEISTEDGIRKATQAEILVALRETKALALESGGITEAEMLTVLPLFKPADVPDETKRELVLLFAEQGLMTHRVCHCLVFGGQRSFKFRRFCINQDGIIMSHKDTNSPASNS